MKTSSDKIKKPTFYNFFRSFIKKGRYRMVTPFENSEVMIASTIYLDGDVLNEINGNKALRYFESKPEMLIQHFDKLNSFNKKLKIFVSAIQNLMTYIFTIVAIKYSYDNIDLIIWQIVTPLSVFGISHIARDYISKPIFWLVQKFAFKSPS